MNKECLPDVLCENVNIIFCGMAPGKVSCDMKHYYAGPRNKFWKALHEVGFTERQIKPSPDSKIRESNYQLLRDNKIGLTDLVKDACGMDNDVTPKKSDVERLIKLIGEYKPKFFAFNGKRTAKYFFETNDIDYGEHEFNEIKETRFFVLPSTAGLASRYWDVKYWQEVNDLVRNLSRK